MFARKKPSGDFAADEKSNTIVIPKRLVLYKNAEFEGNLEVHGNIVGKTGGWHNLTVKDGNLAARDMQLADLNACNVRARSMNIHNLHADNVSVVRKLFGGELWTKNVSAEEIIATRIIARGDINARDIYSLTTISAMDLVIDKDVIATGSISIRNAEVKGSISTEGKIRYYRILHAHEGIYCMEISSKHKNAVHSVSKHNINIKSDIYDEKRD